LPEVSLPVSATALNLWIQPHSQGWRTPIYIMIHNSSKISYSNENNCYGWDSPHEEPLSGTTKTKKAQLLFNHAPPPHSSSPPLRAPPPPLSWVRACLVLGFSLSGAKKFYFLVVTDKLIIYKEGLELWVRKTWKPAKAL
jgi:hypothetical protein